MKIEYGLYGGTFITEDDCTRYLPHLKLQRDMQSPWWQFGRRRKALRMMDDEISVYWRQVMAELSESELPQWGSP